MTQRKRKLIGTIALLALIVVYALLALAVAIVLQVRDANKVAELIYYVVADCYGWCPRRASSHGCKSPMPDRPATWFDPVASTRVS